jgi:serine phosphatase RsbU (regulator of sigma subunit)
VPNDPSPTQRLIRRVLAAFIVIEMLNEVRFWLTRTRRKSRRWWEGVERRGDRRAHDAALVVLLSRLPGARSKKS